MNEEKIQLFKDELDKLELEFKEITQELKEGCGIYEQENWDRRVEVVRRINEVTKLLN